MSFRIKNVFLLWPVWSQKASLRYVQTDSESIRHVMSVSVDRWESNSFGLSVDFSVAKMGF